MDKPVQYVYEYPLNLDYWQFGISGTGIFHLLDYDVTWNKKYVTCRTVKVIKMEYLQTRSVQLSINPYPANVENTVSS
jgi:hypothetical protein